MTFTDTQYEALMKFEGHFKTMLESNYCRNLRGADVDELDRIRDAALGKGHRTNRNCGACISDLIRQIAPYYYADRAERAEIAALSAKVVKSTAKTVKTPTKARK